MRVWPIWSEIPELKIIQANTGDLQPAGTKPFHKISVVIPVRNESDNIEACLTSLRKLTYPKEYWDVIVVNDDSDDNTVAMINSFAFDQCTLLHLVDFENEQNLPQGKKSAITYAIQHTDAEIIVTTDADCQFKEGWLNHINQAFKFSDTVVLCMPVLFAPFTSVIERVQALDFLATMVVNGVGIQTQSLFNGNGANLAFRSTWFTELNGYQSNVNYASGDDVFFIQETAKKNDKGIMWIKNLAAVVYTKPEESIARFMKQRIRWATKTKAYIKSKATLLYGLVWIIAGSILLNLALAFMFNTFFFFIALFQLLIKGIIDFLFLQNAASYYKQDKALKLFPFSFLAYQVYIFVIGILGLVMTRYTWKGRKLQ